MWLLIMWIALVLVGLVLLVKGADWFVDGSAGIARKCKISPLVIGLTVVAFGTSAPELCVSVASAVKGSTEIAIGNVVGSNIANILLILGLSALIHNLPVQKSSLRLDFPVLILSSVLLIVLGFFGRSIAWYDGLIFLAVLAAYMTVTLVQARKTQKKAKRLDLPAEGTEDKPPKGRLAAWYAGMCKKVWFLLILTLVGLGMVVGGGTLLVEGIEYIIYYIAGGKSESLERIVGLTVVAIGTSLPELVTSVVAAKKGETDIAVGNVLGSNIFNILLVAGVSSLFNPLSFTVGANMIDALVALFASLLLCLFSLLPKRRLGKTAGAVMFACFVGYYVFLFCTM